MIIQNSQKENIKNAVIRKGVEYFFTNRNIDIMCIREKFLENWNKELIFHKKVIKTSTSSKV